MKGYFVCFHDGPQWWYCQGLLENGFCFGEHVCSEPSFAPGDLLLHRKDRLAALKALFPESDPATFETLIVESKADLPPWYTKPGFAEEQLALKPVYEKYAALLKAEVSST